MATDKTIIHSVYFWLDEKLTEQEIENFTEYFETLGKIPTIKSFKYGKPAPTTPRPVVDNSFTYNLIVSFANMEDLKVYETHPIHLEAIEKYKHNWVKVTVHDTLVS